MRKYIVAVLLLFYTLNALSCDICGCASGGNYLGILPQFTRNFVGFQYNYSAFRSKHSLLPETSDKQAVSLERFHQTEFWGRLWINKRVQAMVFLPYNFSIKSEDNILLNRSGFGDVRFLGQYTIFNTTDSVSHKIKYALVVGAGGIIATGRASISNQSGDHPNLSPGTGNYAAIWQSSFWVRLAKIGLHTEGFYRQNLVSKTNYEFGDRLSIAARVFWWQRKNIVSILPALGCTYEWSGYDLQDGFRQVYSGGYATQAFVGLQVFFPKWAFSAQFNQPINSNIGQALVQPLNRFTFQTNFLIP